MKQKKINRVVQLAGLLNLMIQRFQLSKYVLNAMLRSVLTVSLVSFLGFSVIAYAEGTGAVDLDVNKSATGVQNVVKFVAKRELTNRASALFETGLKWAIVNGNISADATNPILMAKALNDVVGTKTYGAMTEAIIKAQAEAITKPMATTVSTTVGGVRIGATTLTKAQSAVAAWQALTAITTMITGQDPITLGGTAIMDLINGDDAGDKIMAKIEERWGGKNANEMAANILGPLASSAGGTIVSQTVAALGGTDTVVGATLNVISLLSAPINPWVLVEGLQNPEAFLNNVVQSLKTLVNALTDPVGALVSTFENLGDLVMSGLKAIGGVSKISGPQLVNTDMNREQVNTLLSSVFGITPDPDVTLSDKVKMPTQVGEKLASMFGGKITVDSAVTYAKYLLLKYGDNPTEEQKAELTKGYPNNLQEIQQAVTALMEKLRVDLEVQKAEFNLAQEVEQQEKNMSLYRESQSTREIEKQQIKELAKVTLTDSQKEVLENIQSGLNKIGEFDSKTMTEFLKNTLNILASQADQATPDQKVLLRDAFVGRWEAVLDEVTPEQKTTLTAAFTEVVEDSSGLTKQFSEEVLDDIQLKQDTDKKTEEQKTPEVVITSTRVVATTAEEPVFKQGSPVQEEPQQESNPDVFVEPQIFINTQALQTMPAVPTNPYQPPCH